MGRVERTTIPRERRRLLAQRDDYAEAGVRLLTERVVLAGCDLPSLGDVVTLLPQLHRTLRLGTPVGIDPTLVEAECSETELDLRLGLVLRSQRVTRTGRCGDRRNCRNSWSR